MITLTLEAIYALHMLNNHSGNLPFLPLPAPADETNRKTALRIVLEKGYEDLKDLGLIIDDEPTEDCAMLGAYIKEYAEHYYHVQVDTSFFAAPQVDPYKRMAIILQKVEDNGYIVTRINTVIFLGVLMSSHPILRDLDDKVMNYLRTAWQPYAAMRLMAYYGKNDAIRIKVEQMGTIYSDFLYVDTKSGLFQYDLQTEDIRAISTEQMQERLVRDIKVEV